MNPKCYEGTPCRKCGSSLRYKSNRICVRCANAATLKRNQAEYAADPEIQRRRSANYRARNPEKERARYLKWKAANPEKRRASARMGKRRRREAAGAISQSEIDHLFSDQDGKCAYFQRCGTHLDSQFRCDHIIPVVAGGPNYSWNRQLLCEPCNVKKGRTDPVKFTRENGLDSARALRAVSNMGQFSRIADTEPTP